MDIAAVVAVTALILSLLSIGWQIRDYFSRLRMSVVDLYIPYVHKNMSLALVRLAFVNPSSRVKSVCHIDIDIEGTTIPVYRAKVEVAYSEDLRVLFHKLTKDETNYQFPMPIPESLQIPLDIPPHQSVGKWCAFAVEVEEPYNTNLPPVAWMKFRAYDYKLKVSGFRLNLPRRPMASCGKQIVPGRITTVSWPFYETTES